MLTTSIASPRNGEDWMTTELVNFKADVKIPSTYIGKGTLVIKKKIIHLALVNMTYPSFPITIEY